MVVDTGARYYLPARYDDLLTVSTRLVDFGRIRMRFEYEVSRDGERLATGHTVLASTDSEGRPKRLPADLLERMNSL